jgi:diguanylate cyclase (GGDEF)-like protein
MTEDNRFARAIVTLGLVDYGLGSDSGNYRALILVPLLVLVALTAPALARGTDLVALPGVALSSAAATAIVALVVRALVVGSQRTTRRSEGLVDAAAVAARATNLETGVEALVSVVASCIDALRITAFRSSGHGDRGWEPLTVWPAGSDAHRAPGADPASSASASAPSAGRVEMDGEDVILFSSATDGISLVLTITLRRDRVGERGERRVALERMAIPLEILVGRIQLLDRVEELIRTDSLTGALNRRTLMDQIDQELRVAVRRSEPLAIAIVDLDHLTRFNQDFGRDQGDRLLHSFSQMMIDRVRSCDVTARYNGGEFCLALPNTDEIGARVLISDLRHRLEGHTEFSSVTFSAGIAVWDSTEPARTVLRRASAAKFRAKENGRNRTASAQAGDDWLEPVGTRPRTRVGLKRQPELSAER